MFFYLALLVLFFRSSSYLHLPFAASTCRDNSADANDSGTVLPAELWGRLRSVTAGLSQRLCEQLRLVLEPMVATKLQGDYRSGKRINMRRVIPYIASGFRKDKIWLRRTKPAKRDYQVWSLSRARPRSFFLVFKTLLLPLSFSGLYGERPRLISGGRGFSKLCRKIFLSQN